MPTGRTDAGGTPEPANDNGRDQPEAEALFASIGEGIITTDDNGRISRVNKAALAILGYSPEALLGNWFPSTIIATYDDGSAIDTMERPVTKAIMTGQTVTARTQYRRQNGSLVPVSLTVSPIIRDGKPVGAVEVFRDITLEIKSDKMKSEFISVASHQLRTPLSAINVYSHMLDDGIAGPLNNQQTTFIKSILQSVERMNVLISTLLNITRIEAGGVNVKISHVKLQDLAGEIISENRPTAEDKGLRVTEHVDTATPALDTDALLVKEVYANLISNAIKYTPAGGKLAISLSVKGNNIVFCVKDTGYGIPRSAQPHIFTKFFRADNILGEDVSGTGLGLYLTKTIAESLNGELWFDSQEGKGSAFYFSLPKQGSIGRHGRFKLGG